MRKLTKKQLDDWFEMFWEKRKEGKFIPFDWMRVIFSEKTARIGKKKNRGEIIKKP